jgi:hypothetical protein
MVEQAEHSDRLDYLPEVTLTVTRRARIQTQGDWSEPRFSLVYCAPASDVYVCFFLWTVYI